MCDDLDRNVTCVQFVQCLGPTVTAEQLAAASGWYHKAAHTLTEAQDW